VLQVEVYQPKTFGSDSSIGLVEIDYSTCVRASNRWAISQAFPLMDAEKKTT
jgi:hypothetical protein